MTSETWARRIGAYINGAHWLSHSLQEAAGPLLLLDQEGKPPRIVSPLHGYSQF
jgi:hypothetical protein